MFFSYIFFVSGRTMTLNKMPKNQTKRKRSFPPLFLNTFMLVSTCTVTIVYF